MKDFFDTSVLISAFWGDHPRHEASLKILSEARKKESACGAHSLAEVYAVMTALPAKPVMPPEQVLLFVEQVRGRLSIVTLDEADYFDTIQKTAEQGFTSGRIYDALLLRCAAKAKARTIYTWNVKHFQALAPELADRIRTP